MLRRARVDRSFRRVVMRRTADEASALLSRVDGRDAAPSWRRARAAGASIGAALAFALAVAALGARMISREPAYGSALMDARVKKTKTQYEAGVLTGNNALTEIRWTREAGFFIVGGAGTFSHWFGSTRNFRTMARDVIAASVKRHFPERLAEGQAPFSVLVSLSDATFSPCQKHDYAFAHSDKCETHKWVPIFAFGSTPRNDDGETGLYRKAPLITLVDCYVDRIGDNESAIRANESPSCKNLNFASVKYANQADCVARTAVESCEPYHRGLFNTEMTADPSLYEWANLNRTVFWRGNDFEYLWDKAYDWGAPASDAYLEQLAATPQSKLYDAMTAMYRNHDIGPRFKAVLMSKLYPELIDAKFFDWGNWTGNRGGGGDRVGNGKKVGVDAENRSKEDEIARYRYLLDLGGAGGTTFTGTISKLAMPGVLLHHVTPTVDSYFRYLTPWVHYIPLKEDLSDLSQKITWIENNPEAAQKIARESIDWVKWFRKVSTLLAYNKQQLVEPLRAVVDPDGEFYVD